MYNEVDYKRRQSFFSGKIDWNTDELYFKYAGIVGSATAQQIIKNNEAWKSFFLMLKRKKQGKPSKNIKKMEYQATGKTEKQESEM